MDIQRGGSDSSGDSDDAMSSYSLGDDWTLEIPLTAILDGNITNDVGVSYKHNTTKKVSFCWQFNSFKQSLFYDPILCSTYNDGGQSSNKSRSQDIAWGWIVFIVAIVIVVIVGAACWNRRRKQQQEIICQHLNE